MPHLSLHYLFDWRWVSFSTFTGWMIVIACVFNALAASICLMMLVSAALLPSLSCLPLLCKHSVAIACSSSHWKEELLQLLIEQHLQAAQVPSPDPSQLILLKNEHHPILGVVSCAG